MHVSFVPLAASASFTFFVPFTLSYLRLCGHCHCKSRLFGILLTILTPNIPYPCYPFIIFDAARTLRSSRWRVRKILELLETESTSITVIQLQGYVFFANSMDIFMKVSTHFLCKPNPHGASFRYSPIFVAFFLLFLPLLCCALIPYLSLIVHPR